MPDYTIVQCGQGHYFSTIWLPLVSFKAVRLGDRRLQRCPVCRRFRSVVRVSADQLSAEELRAAEALKDSRLP
ncbi:hypothetical protein G3I59_38915 [Amycolatopsis rubida]|uniref:Uncharacterized protein n=1 Tax=Amycolatopsis rubida TaxID=112413 RepID=A0A1I5YIW0_9PSEU|nr:MULTISPECIES: hypothetical protein [Amycolatopsis]MYW96431.1 hypothetical protein [Amycolatopsis rubida]NEC61418.1 hypothetical protein [Amycolatopsis rubida]OAP28111.1 hypothetical protein A4R44_01721 [Amycolatopsis sp. M39]SFQ44151.1 hypothetical protein SAMN05421854_112126 [Amycolatopsis rubida]